MLLLHGYFANRYQVLGVAEGLRQRGYEALLLELRGHGERPGPCTLGLREAEDVGVVLEWADGAEQSARLPLAFLGFSMGAAIGCRVAARYPQVRALVADSLYARFRPILARYIRRHYRLPAVPFAWVTWQLLHAALRMPAGSLDPGGLAPSIHRPLLAIYGEADQHIAAPLWREVVERWGGLVECWVEPGVAHVDLYARAPDRYCDRVAAFLARTLA